MLLKELKHEKTAVCSRWELTYPASWQDICRAVYHMYDYYSAPEVLVMGRPVPVSGKEDILKIGESMNLCLRGASTILKVPISITFYNQVKQVHVTVMKLAKEYEQADYQSLNLSLGQYLDSVELMTRVDPKGKANA